MNVVQKTKARRLQSLGNIQEMANNTPVKRMFEASKRAKPSFYRLGNHGCEEGWSEELETLCRDRQGWKTAVFQIVKSRSNL